MGDEQSLENDLSTYSSHLLNMKNFIRYASQDTLILIDESAREPNPCWEGDSGSHFKAPTTTNKRVITTHYTNLKHFASSAPGSQTGPCSTTATGCAALPTGNRETGFIFCLRNRQENRLPKRFWTMPPVRSVKTG
ncbi:MAG: hypothetical protein ACLTZT_13335 [Butyricimonas faecalis]